MARDRDLKVTGNKDVLASRILEDNPNAFPYADEDELRYLMELGVIDPNELDPAATPPPEPAAAKKASPSAASPQDPSLADMTEYMTRALKELEEKVDESAVAEVKELRARMEDLSARQRESDAWKSKMEAELREAREELAAARLESEEANESNSREIAALKHQIHSLQTEQQDWQRASMELQQQTQVQNELLMSQMLKLIEVTSRRQELRDVKQENTSEIRSMLAKFVRSPWQQRPGELDPAAPSWDRGEGPVSEAPLNGRPGGGVDSPKQEAGLKEGAGAAAQLLKVATGMVGDLGVLGYETARGKEATGGERVVVQTATVATLAYLLVAQVL